jgi:hypothetical protein
VCIGDLLCVGSAIAKPAVDLRALERDDPEAAAASPGVPTANIGRKRGIA